jgi:LmbE family N-acetylglucosaminyl deacetylase
VSGQAPRPAGSTRTLLAVFAHPDDEAIAGPLLAKYATEKGTRVVLAVVTNGDKGVTPFAGIPAGEALAAGRAKEAACSARELGIEPPVLFGLPDGADRDLVLTHRMDTLGSLAALLLPAEPLRWTKSYWGQIFNRADKRTSP